MLEVYTGDGLSALYNLSFFFFFFKYALQWFYVTLRENTIPSVLKLPTDSSLTEFQVIPHIDEKGLCFVRNITALIVSVFIF